MKKRPEQTARTKAELEQAFWQLYSTTPLEKITVGALCERAGYNRGTFYLHFRDLYALLEEREEALLAGMTECIEACMQRLAKDSGKLSLIAACTDVVLFYERNKVYIRALLGTRGDSSFMHRLKDNLKPLWREYVLRPNTARSDDEVELMLEYTLTGTLYMISDWLTHPGETSASDLAHLVYDFAIKDARSRAQD
ncbi:MAG: TetR/AcrR family transcriptional regulator [Eggerthellaceae bacterium]|nr:TetR/AcrR family transcriptional regulator [Eggerthellaceae bacterium]